MRERAQLLITNPDMLHCSILPVHRQFGALSGNLRYVVVDEGHAYRRAACASCSARFNLSACRNAYASTVKLTSCRGFGVPPIGCPYMQPCMQRM